MPQKRRAAKTYDFNRFLNIEKPADQSERPEREGVKSEGKGKRKRIRIGFVLLVIFVLYTLTILGSQQLRLYRFERDIDRVAGHIKEAETHQEALRQQIDLMNTDEYIEKMAREKLGLIKPGEIPYIAVPSENEADVRVIDHDATIVDVED